VTSRVPFRLRLRRALTRDRITVHLHALCWNEERLLPYFFRHYDDIVDRYYVYDHDSTDRSVELLTSHRNVVLGRFEVTGGSFVRAATAHYNHCWKQSRGVADWVFVVNIDEHLYHPRLRAYLRACTRRGVSVIVPEGYNMVSDGFPTSRKPLWSTIRYGARDTRWDKPQFFDPNKVEDIDFKEGRHSATPRGDIVYPKTTRTKLLHFKYLGVDYLVRRHAELRSVFPAADLAQGFAYQYLWSEQRNVEELERARANAVRVV
jgi:hypothetical protein